MYRTLRSPPLSPWPPPHNRDNGPNRIQAEYTQWLITKKYLNIVTWSPPQEERAASRVDMVTLGDSYADDIDMGFHCWPSLVARQQKQSCLNLARGGATSSAGLTQYEQALRFAQASGLVIGPQTTVLVHLGGNDLLFLLWLGPPAFMLMFMDFVNVFILRRFAGSGPLRGRVLRYSFFGLAAARIQGNLTALLRRLREARHRKVIICGLPLCGVVPTARAVVMTLLGAWFWQWLLPRGYRNQLRKAIGEMVDDTAALVQEELFAACRAAWSEAGSVPTEASARPGEEESTPPALILLDEASAIRALAQREAHPGGLQIWKDGHHPNALTHARLASSMQEQLKDQDVG